MVGGRGLRREWGAWLRSSVGEKMGQGWWGIGEAVGGKGWGNCGVGLGGKWGRRGGGGGGGVAGGYERGCWCKEVDS